MQEKLIKRAIEVSQEERNQLAQEIEELEKQLKITQERLILLDNFIAQGKQLLGLDAELNDASPQAPMTDEAALIGDQWGPGPWSVASGIYSILKHATGGLHPKEIALEFNRRNWPISRRYGTEVVRLALKKRTDLFERHEDGTFSAIKLADMIHKRGK